MAEERGRRAHEFRTKASLVVIAFSAFVATQASAQQEPPTLSQLWADEIHYQGSPQFLRAQGGVRLRVNSDDGEIVLLTQSLDYDKTKGLLRAQGGDFGKKRHVKRQGALRLLSGDVIFFQKLEADSTTLLPLKGEGLGWRNGKGKRGGLSAASFQRRQRKQYKEDDWVFRQVRYTRCPICADALAKREQRAKSGKAKSGEHNAKTKDRTHDPLQKTARSFPPLWRIDAARIRWERFDKKPRGWFGAVPRIHLFHSRLSLYGVPVFYSPYFSFPSNGARASGLLPPTYGQNSARGGYIAPPLYWAPHRGWDMTYLPIFTTRHKDSSRFETRIAWGAGNKEKAAETEGAEEAGGEKKSGEQKTSASKPSADHLFDVNIRWSLPHDRIGEGDKARFFAYGKLRWRAPWGLRADAVYHGLGDRRYLHDYGQGIDLFSTTAPSTLQDRWLVEHFSRNGYARLLLAEQHDLLTKPRADAWLLPEMTYAQHGLFARSRRGGGSWQVEGMWRGAGQDQQGAIETLVGADIEEQKAFRQDIVSAALNVGWRQNLPWSFVSQSKAKFATTYIDDSEEGEQLVLLPEFQQSLEGLFAKSFKKGQRVFYLRPLLELYATLDENRGIGHGNPRDDSRNTIGGEAAFYETGARLGERLAFDSALDGGQRLLLATELGVRGAQESSAVLFVAPNLLRQKGDILSGRLWTGTRLSWRERILFRYDTTWLLPTMQWLDQTAQIEAKGDAFSLALGYEEFRAFDKPTLYEQDITLKGDLRLRQNWHFNLSAGYGFLGQSVPIGFSLTYKGSCVTLNFSYDRTIYSNREDSESFNVSLGFTFS